MLHDYLNLDVDLLSLYAQWSKLDDHFARVSPGYLGVRMLRQDPLENLLCFVCSSNNNIARITAMVDALCLHYGTSLGELDGRAFYGFPTLPQLLGKIDTLEPELRSLGFGYRAAYIAKTVRQLSLLPADYLMGLRKVSFEECRLALQRFAGVGPKVADCVCLMSMDKTQAVPIDTHVLQIAERDYRWRYRPAKRPRKQPSVVNKAESDVGAEEGVKAEVKAEPGAASNSMAATQALTPAVVQKSKASPAYESCSRFFRDLWGEYAGWAHSVLFTADLRAFRDGVAGSAPFASIKAERGGAEVKREPESELEGGMKSEPDIKIDDNDIKAELGEAAGEDAASLPLLNLVTHEALVKSEPLEEHAQNAQPASTIDTAVKQERRPPRKKARRR